MYCVGVAGRRADQPSLWRGGVGPCAQWEHARRVRQAALENLHAELLVLDIAVVRDDADIGVELLGLLGSDQSLGLPYVFHAEEELSVQVRDVDCIEVHDLKVLEARKHKHLRRRGAAPLKSSTHLPKRSQRTTRGSNGTP
jgi:hypothetical protein